MFKQLLLIGLATTIFGFRRYMNMIPNGHKVPSPCNDTIWEGVGHFLPQGSGPRNPFGEDFQSANETWTQDLCQKDSDGDGKTNGQELGDPNCHWSVTDANPHLQDPTGHPGICEPVGSARCSSSGFSCHPDIPVGK